MGGRNNEVRTRIRRMRSGCKHIVIGILWKMSEVITQERIAAGSSNFVERLIMSRNVSADRTL